MPGRLAFVPPRFGAGVVGGSESVMREAASGLAGRGWDVEVLTTCAVDHYTWGNDLPEGRSEEDGLVVHRFPTVHRAARALIPVQLAVQAGDPVSLEDQLSWMGWRFAVPDLYHHLMRHGPGFDAVVFSPYMFWTTTVCMPVVADRAVVIPCLHDETYARLEVMRPVLHDPASVWFLSEPEHQLAHRLGPVATHHRVTGAGVDVPGGYDPEGFKARHRIRRPFILYAGRREPEKGWNWLLDTYAEAIRIGGVSVDLVSIGVGDIDVPPDLFGRVIDLGYVEERERDNAFAAATAYVQPSRMESFSRSVMEAWLAGTPVLAYARSEVVAWHCERSGGGRIFSGAEDFRAALQWLAEAPDEAAVSAERGKRYVLTEYSWNAVLDRMEADLEVLTAPAGAGRQIALSLVLVAGSYPPIPVPAAAATVDAVRRAWADGDEVRVVSPRSSAAHYAVSYVGLRAGRRLDNVRRRSGATRLVLCVEPGVPFPETRPGRRLGRIGSTLTAVLLARTMRRFDGVSVVNVGDLVLPPKARTIVEKAASEVIEDPRPGRAPPGVTARGPVEMSWRDRAHAAVAKLARAVLGERTGRVRSASVAATAPVTER